MIAENMKVKRRDDTFTFGDFDSGTIDLNHLHKVDNMRNNSGLKNAISS